eukprot:41861_1
MGARCCTNDSSIDKTSLIKDRPTTVSNGPNMKVNEGKALFSLIVGEWIGQCQTVKGFEYGEEIKFIDKNQPFLTYLSQTWKKGENENLMHSENGYVRFPSDMQIDLIVSQCTGINEISSGNIQIVKNEIDDEKESQTKNASFVVTLSSETILRVDSASKPYVMETQRIYKYDGSKDILSYEISMSTTNEKEVTKHLLGTFSRNDKP